MTGWEPEDLQPAAEAIRARVLARIGNMDVTVFESTSNATPPLHVPEEVFAYADGERKRVVLATPLVLTAFSRDGSLWPKIDRTLGEDGFVPFGERSSLGTQAYVSTKRAWFLVPANPGATRAVDMVGRALLGWIRA